LTAPSIRESAPSVSSTNTHTVTGTATSDSKDGYVMVDMGGDSLTYSDDQSVPVSTTTYIKKGDNVIVNLIGADGTGKTPIVIGIVGGGDRQQDEINSVKYYVFNDDEGLHITTKENDATTGNNLLLTGGEIQFRYGTEIIARHKYNEISLGENSIDSIIKLCGKYGLIYANQSAFVISTDRSSIASSWTSSTEIRSHDITTESSDFPAFVKVSYNASDGAFVNVVGDHISFGTASNGGLDDYVYMAMDDFIKRMKYTGTYTIHTFLSGAFWGDGKQFFSSIPFPHADSYTFSGISISNLTIVCDGSASTGTASSVRFTDASVSGVLVRVTFSASLGKALKAGVIECDLTFTVS
jgi:hypothetical protein